MRSIASLFASDTLVKLLAIFLLHADTAFYQSELSDQIGGHLRNTQKMLQKLQETGLIRHYKKGRMSYYQANKHHPAFEELKRLFLKTIALGDLLRESLKPMAEHIRLACIFGSFATGEETPDSDIDVLIVGNLSLKSVAKALGPISDTVKREVNPLVFTPRGFAEGYEEKNRIVEVLVSCPKLWLVGSQDDLEDLVG
ncbi:MAG: nucleotidyltransferase domain-containing protein [Cyanobacteria bacterium HKST-UBA06]|nr:nucleotidyltransferase domain-containing protein [Cyanobacteria bacterium HKST-UBA06]